MTPTEAQVRTANPQRIVSPDVARGVTLLGIALANVVTAWTVNDAAELAGTYGGVYEDSLLDKIAVVLGAMFVHVRGLPMFATLLGLGIGMIVMSLWRRGYPAGRARGVIARRYGFLALFGVVHLVFLFYGDILVFYGLAGMVMALLITLRDKVLLWIAGVLLALQAVVFVALGIVLALSPDLAELFSGGAGGFTDPATYGENLLLGLLILASGIVSFPVQALIFLPLIMLGFVAARRGILTDTRAHRKLLVTWIWVGVAVILLVGLPWGLAEIGVLPTALAPAFQMANAGLGQLTGPAIIAAVALLSQPLQDRINREREAGKTPTLPFVVRAMAALGKRSMTGYVLQSVFLIILVRPFALELGAEQGAFELSLIAIGVWLATVAIAVALEYADKPGPLEYVHRRLSYGRQGLQDSWRQKHPRTAGAAASADGPVDIVDPGVSPLPGEPAPPLDPHDPDVSNPYRDARVNPQPGAAGEQGSGR